MRNCWAVPEGNCSSKITGEHTVTTALFQTDVVQVRGLPWCANEFKTIGLANLTRKILCAHHNAELSKWADDPAVEAFKVFRQCKEIADIRTELSPRHFGRKKYSVDGRGLERWFLKTLLNVCFEHWPVGMNAVTADQVPKQLVDIAFGKENFGGKAGLYLPARLEQSLELSEHVRVATLVRSDRVMGAAYSFYGYRFLIWLDSDANPDLLGIRAFDDVWDKFDLLHRPRRIKRADVAVWITFTWKVSTLPGVRRRMR